jgi:hypothetical protein
MIQLMLLDSILRKKTESVKITGTIYLPCGSNLDFTIYQGVSIVILTILIYDIIRSHVFREILWQNIEANSM